MNNFRKWHLLQILESFPHQNKPIDVFLNSYYRTHKSIGSKDRQEISEHVYGMIRYKSLLEYLCPESNWEKKLNVYFDQTFLSKKEDPSIPEHHRLAMPWDLYKKLHNQYGHEKTRAIAKINNTEAPITIRINGLKANRASVFAHLSNRYEVSLCSYSEWGIQFAERINFQELPEFKNGLFEVQDEGSQLVSFLVKAKPKDKVMDFCAGAGGKTLGFAPFLQNKGIIYLHDIRPFALAQARKRCSRAGIYNIQFMPKLERLKGKLDYVIVDVPCSGTGTYRRNVDLKWKFSSKMLEDLLQEQRVIFSEALNLVKKGGHIIYATCSILKEENENQIEYFLEKHQLKLKETPFSTLPLYKGMDGFFAATMIAL